MPESGRALVWHDLSVNYWQQARLAPTEAAEPSERALAAAKESVTLDPTRWQHWNQLGIVAASPCEYHYYSGLHCNLFNYLCSNQKPKNVSQQKFDVSFS